MRTAAPGTTFSLAEHPEHELDAPEERKFLITSVVHRARNNLAEILADAAPQNPASPAVGRPENSNPPISTAANSPPSAPGSPGGRLPAPGSPSARPVPTTPRPAILSASGYASWPRSPAATGAAT
ncbi:hypothetical protein KI615_12925 [Dechloromonas denitrificans]|nr:hypothetical protein KI611_12855 [Dechloromonas denitrificans]UCV10087.1 hypothetical protein KI615_12925 [Dechloromonas denitrificans]